MVANLKELFYFSPLKLYEKIGNYRIDVRNVSGWSGFGTCGI